jgi:iron complex transport system permease protein
MAVITLALMSGSAASAPLMTRAGSVGIPSDTELINLAAYTGVGLLFAVLLIPKCNVLSLGDKTARGLGVKVNLYKGLIAATGVPLCAAASSAVGITAFVGLLAPLGAERLLGANYAKLTPLSAILGAFTVSFADFLGRCVINKPFSMPVGIITVAVGGAIFIFLLKKSGKRV